MSTSQVGTSTVTSKMKLTVTLVTLLVPIIGFVMGVRYLKSDVADNRAAARLWLLASMGGFIPYFFGLCIMYGGVGAGSG